MQKRFDGQRVLVTQASTFMGPVIGEVFSAEGAEVIVDERDLRKSGAAEALIRETGRVDVVIANLAAVNPKTSVIDTSDDMWLGSPRALWVCGLRKSSIVPLSLLFIEQR